MTERMTEERIAEIKARCEAATKGPWEIWDGPGWCGGGSDLSIGAGEQWLADMEIRDGNNYHERVAHGDCAVSGCTICSMNDEISREQKANAEFIIHSRDDIPALLAEVEACHQEIADIREATENAMREDCGNEKHCTCVPLLRREIVRLKKGPAGWEAEHQRRALETVGLAEEFPFGCDAIEAVAEALLASRGEVERLREEVDELKRGERF